MRVQLGMGESSLFPPAFCPQSCLTPGHAGRIAQRYYAQPELSSFYDPPRSLYHTRARGYESFKGYLCPPQLAWVTVVAKLRACLGWHCVPSSFVN